MFFLYNFERIFWDFICQFSTNLVKIYLSATTFVYVFTESCTFDPYVLPINTYLRDVMPLRYTSIKGVMFLPFA